MKVAAVVTYCISYHKIKIYFDKLDDIDDLWLVF